MTEAHQAEGIVFILGLGNKLVNAVDRADLLQHFDNGLVGATVGRAPQCGNASGDAGERIGLR